MLSLIDDRLHSNVRSLPSLHLRQATYLLCSNALSLLLTVNRLPAHDLKLDSRLTRLKADYVVIHCSWISLYSCSIKPAGVMTPDDISQKWYNVTSSVSLRLSRRRLPRWILVRLTTCSTIFSLLNTPSKKI